jgi:hypothetical protein
MTSNSLVLPLTRLSADGLSEVACPGCHDHLIIHQPDEQLPRRLLGTCPSCFAWYLIDAAAAVMVRLPDEDALRDPWTAVPTGPRWAARLGRSGVPQASRGVLRPEAALEPAGADAGGDDEPEDHPRGDGHAPLVVHPSPQRQVEGIGQELGAMRPVEILADFADPLRQAHVELLVHVILRWGGSWGPPRRAASRFIRIIVHGGLRGTSRVEDVIPCGNPWTVGPMVTTGIVSRLSRSPPGEVDRVTT